MTKPWFANVSPTHQADSAVSDVPLDVMEIQRGIAGVYFLQASNGLIKIGQSADIKQMANSIDMGSPLPIMLVGFIAETPGDLDRQSLESKLHTYFGNERVRYEWFVPTIRLTDFVWRINQNWNRLPAGFDLQPAHRFVLTFAKEDK
ncbi:MAG: GIY-YIG nuclease family protein [Anaerolineae bacterium]|nr:GIY-YIG nuclease family protein [Anaerolineae bacterium]